MQAGTQTQGIANVRQRMAAQGATWRRGEQDLEMRKGIAKQIYDWFQRRKNNAQLNARRLPELVKMLEDVLYHSASSQDEYLDLKTLEQRLQQAGKELRSKQPQAAAGNAGAGGPMQAAAGQGSSGQAGASVQGGPGQSAAGPTQAIAAPAAAAAAAAPAAASGGATHAQATVAPVGAVASSATSAAPAPPASSAALTSAAAAHPAPSATPSSNHQSAPETANVSSLIDRSATPPPQRAMSGMAAGVSAGQSTAPASSPGQSTALSSAQPQLSAKEPAAVGGPPAVQRVAAGRAMPQGGGSNLLEGRASPGLQGEAVGGTLLPPSSTMAFGGGSGLAGQHVAAAGRQQQAAHAHHFDPPILTSSQVNSAASVGHLGSMGMSSRPRENGMTVMHPSQAAWAANGYSHHGRPHQQQHMMNGPSTVVGRPMMPLPHASMPRSSMPPGAMMRASMPMHAAPYPLMNQPSHPNYPGSMMRGTQPGHGSMMLQHQQQQQQQQVTAGRAMAMQRPGGSQQLAPHMPQMNQSFGSNGGGGNVSSALRHHAAAAAAASPALPLMANGMAMSSGLNGRPDVMGANHHQMATNHHQMVANHQMPAMSSLSAAADAAPTSAATPMDPQRALQYQRQQKWLHMLRHASSCLGGDKCPLGGDKCQPMRDLWGHCHRCMDPNCAFPRCVPSRKLIIHHKNCKEPTCPVCGPVRRSIHNQFARKKAAAEAAAKSAAERPSQEDGKGLDSDANPEGLPPGGKDGTAATEQESSLAVAREEAGSEKKREAWGDGEQLCSLKRSAEEANVAAGGGSDVEQVAKRVKRENEAAAGGGRAGVASVAAVAVNVEEELGSVEVKPNVVGKTGAPATSASQKASASRGAGQKSKSKEKLEKVKAEGGSGGLAAPASTPSGSAAAAAAAASVSGSKAGGKASTEAKQQRPMQAGVSSSGQAAGQKQRQQAAVAPAAAAATTAAAAVAAGTKQKAKSVGTSLTELFTPDMIRAHVRSLRDPVGQSRAKMDRQQAAAIVEVEPKESDCRLCAVEKLFFDPPPIYCTVCGRRIQRNKVFFSIGAGEQRQCICNRCHGDFRGDTITIEGMPPIPKSRLEKRVNDDEQEEAWVQCDQCELWVHQVCALFNGRRNEGETEYTCPQCCADEMERGVRQPLSPSAVLGAKDLPRTVLSDHLEARLAGRLKGEVAERARQMGVREDEVPTAEELVIRVVSSVDKKLETKPRFLGIFPEGEYPKEFPYKSKVVLLFQRIEGVEVCLYAMYVQEFGSDCSSPNHRRVYLSYLDSIKYFRPETRTVSGEALRTFVYHEILIGYLDYCKRRGFTSCYIWACPPLKGEDYILYCHPEIQKTPQPVKLREWYLTMLKKAAAENIVVEINNLYDTFFVQVAESRAIPSASRLPYFDGDYWPGAIEDELQKIAEEQEEQKKAGQKKGKKSKASSKRGGGGMKGFDEDGTAPLSLDTQLMAKLGEAILQMKDDFIMVHMHYCCSHCKNFILNGRRWLCPLCKNFLLCESCYALEEKRSPSDRHPVLQKDFHDLQLVIESAAPSETKDPDEMMESEFFDTRQAFLSLCQGNHYQYDTLRRAKHSSMMVLYHLHNPTAPAFVATCNVCHRDIEHRRGWRCDTCPDFDVCDECKEKTSHPHNLVSHASQPDRTAQSQEGRQQRINEVRKMLELLAHAASCRLPVQQCTFPKCGMVKALFHHGRTCTVKSAGGCQMCKKMWTLLHLHARSCKETVCRVPRCKDLKEHLRRSVNQAESRRRKAVQEMMRQRQAALAGGNS